MDKPSVTSLDYCETNYVHEDQVAKALTTMVDEPTAQELSHVFQALSDPTRLRLISALRDTELCVCDIAAVLEMSQSAVSHQLRMLRHLQIVQGRKDGRMVYYTLASYHVRALLELGLGREEYVDIASPPLHRIQASEGA